MEQRNQHQAKQRWVKS